MHTGKQKKVDIVLSNRIGDSIFSIPVLLCLKQLLLAKIKNNYNIRILSSNMMTNLYNTFDIFDFVNLDYKIKAKSLLFPADMTIFLQTSDKNFGLCGKTTYGENDIKKRFNHNLEYLNVSDKWQQSKLANHLKENFNFYPIVIKNFGLLTTLGYSQDEIIETFKFDSNTLNLKSKYSKLNLDISNYAVICKEAGYNPKFSQGRLWGDNNFYDTSKYLWEKYNLKSIYVGIKDDPLLNEPYIIDMRNKLNTLELADLFKNAKYYVGNDSGLLHFANMMKCKAIGIHWDKIIMNTFVSMYPLILKRFLMPETPNCVFEEISSTL